mmetsp:Transcript_73088/g.202720  ORF Transcript_73088/g.202720 Transcript_73088/m.202720 type:complete len:202 (+) Transcript_73088:54-659(+)
MSASSRQIHSLGALGEFTSELKHNVSVSSSLRFEHNDGLSSSLWSRRSQSRRRCRDSRFASPGPGASSFDTCLGPTAVGSSSRFCASRSLADCRAARCSALKAQRKLSFPTCFLDSSLAARVKALTSSNNVSSFASSCNSKLSPPIAGDVGWSSASSGNGATPSIDFLVRERETIRGDAATSEDRLRTSFSASAFIRSTSD